MIPFPALLTKLDGKPIQETVLVLSIDWHHAVLARASGKIECHPYETLELNVGKIPQNGILVPGVAPVNRG